jgi:GTP pyrophosphokinase
MNDRLVPLRTKLNNGDIVEIITQNNHQPGKDWLSFVITSKARAKIKHFFRAKQREEEIRIGTELLEKAIRKAGGKLSRLQKDGTLKRVVSELGVSNEEDLFAAIGSHKYTIKQVLERVYPENEGLEHEHEQDIAESKRRRSRKSKVTKSGGAIKVKGVDNVLTRFGNCCKPLPGDKIVGYITRGRGITIHSIHCSNVRSLDLDNERKIEVEWDTDPDIYYPAELYITGKARQSIFADIISAIAKTNTDIITSSSETSATQLEVCCVINVLGRDHLNKVIRSIQKVRSVVDVRQDGFMV